MARSKFQIPYIESEHRYAQLFTSANFVFQNYPTKYIKHQIAENPEILLGDPTGRTSAVSDFVCVEFYHNCDYTENYLWICRNKYDKKHRKFNKKAIIKNLVVSKDYLTKLFEHAGLGNPFANEQQPVYTTGKASSGNSPAVTATPSSTPDSAMQSTPYPERQTHSVPPAAPQEKSSWEMDEVRYDYGENTSGRDITAQALGEDSSDNY